MKQLRLDKRALFARLGYEPHPGQLLVHKSLAPRRIVACGVRWGKSLCAAMEAVAAAMQPAERSIGWCVGPTYDLSDRIFREVELIAAKHLRHRIVTLKENERRLILRNLGGGLSEVRGKSADNSVSLLGEGLDWLIADEAARMKPAIWQSHLSQRLIDKHGWASWNGPRTNEVLNLRFQYPGIPPGGMSVVIQWDENQKSLAERPIPEWPNATWIWCIRRA